MIKMDRCGSRYGPDSRGVPGAGADLRCTLQLRGARRRRRRHQSYRRLANVTADYVREAEAVKPLLKQQVCAPVRWQQSVERLLADGVDTFVEIGPGHTLTGFMKKILKQAKVPADTVQVYNVETMDDFKEYMSK